MRPLAAAHGCRALSLRGLAAAFLGLRVNKAAQRSNWEAEVLSESQLVYAATDAWVCREVYAICAGAPSDEEWRLNARKALAPNFWADASASAADSDTCTADTKLQ